MKITYVANAGFIVDLANGARLVTDPWLSPGANYGSFWNYPPVPESLQESYVDGADVVYVSHVHPDHLDPAVLARLDPATPIVIAKFGHNHLQRAITSARPGELLELDLDQPFEIAGAQITILGQFGVLSDGQPDAVNYEMDTSLLVRDSDGTTLLHLVDNPITAEGAAELIEIYGRPDVAILPYSGASAYPHAFAYSDEDKDRRTLALRATMLDRFVELAATIDAAITIPAAGSYVIGSRIAGYTRWLHQATPAEIVDAWSTAGLEPSRLAMMGSGQQVDTEAPERFVATKGFTAEERLGYALTLAEEPLPHEGIRVPAPFTVPWPRLLFAAEKKVRARQEQLGTYEDIEVRIEVLPTEGLPNGASHRFSMAAPGAPAPAAWVEFRVDASLMLMFLIGAAVWNNAECGGLIGIDREPDTCTPTVHTLMSFFTVV